MNATTRANIDVEIWSVNTAAAPTSTNNSGDFNRACSGNFASSGAGACLFCYSRYTIPGNNHHDFDYCRIVTRDANIGSNTGVFDLVDAKQTLNHEMGHALDLRDCAGDPPVSDTPGVCQFTMVAPNGATVPYESIMHSSTATGADKKWYFPQYLDRLKVTGATGVISSGAGDSSGQGDDSGGVDPP
jgi:hypothetical protein